MMADQCGCGGYWQVFENGTFCKDCDRRKVTPNCEPKRLTTEEETNGR